jgi:hypothetical protein
MALFRHGWICQFIYQFMQLFMDFHGNIMIKHGKFVALCLDSPSSPFLVTVDLWFAAPVPSRPVVPGPLAMSLRRGTSSRQKDGEPFPHKTWVILGGFSAPHGIDLTCDDLQSWAPWRRQSWVFAGTKCPKGQCWAMEEPWGTHFTAFYTHVWDGDQTWSNMIKPQTSFWYGLNQQPAM